MSPVPFGWAAAPTLGGADVFGVWPTVARHARRETHNRKHLFANGEVGHVVGDRCDDNRYVRTQNQWKEICDCYSLGSIL